MSARSIHPWRAASGFTLLEVMIALVVLAVGLLGSSAMVLDGLRASRTALQRSMAVTLAADLADCIRANRGAGNAYSVAPTAIVAPPPTSCGVPGACSPGEIAELDLHRWQTMVFAALPGSTTTVMVAAVSGVPSLNEYMITIRWTEHGDTTPAQFSLRLEA